MEKLTKPYLLAAAMRALRTFLQTLLGTLTATAALGDVNWKLVLITAIASSAYSLVTSISMGLPEIPDEKNN